VTNSQRQVEKLIVGEIWQIPLGKYLMCTAFSLSKVGRCLKQGDFTDRQKAACPRAREWYEGKCGSFRLSGSAVEALGFFKLAQANGDVALAHQILGFTMGRK